MKNKPGYATFMTILVVMGAILMFMGAGSLRGISFGKLGLTVKRGWQLRAGAEGCLEEALWRVRNDWRYNGGSVAVGEIHCQISVSGSGTSRSIAITATDGDNNQLRLDALVQRRGFSVNLIKRGFNE